MGRRGESTFDTILNVHVSWSKILLIFILLSAFRPCLHVITFTFQGDTLYDGGGHVVWREVFFVAYSVFWRSSHSYTNEPFSIASETRETPWNRLRYKNYPRSNSSHSKLLDNTNCNNCAIVSNVFILTEKQQYFLFLNAKNDSNSLSTVVCF